MKNNSSIPRGTSDLLKIMSAISVMLAHYYNLKSQTGYTLNPVEWIIRSQGGNVGVAIFFFLSGYGLMMSELRSHLELIPFIKKRFLKIYLTSHSDHSHLVTNLLLYK